ncbi:TPA: hypothetical protein ACOEPG_001337 [Stenotrophomonas maltophilia]|nr:MULTISPECIES: hypothetical protein [Stenotrophomonas]MDQ7293198.1 hypothetical protein [Stenotrophomonas sp. Sm0041]
MLRGTHCDALKQNVEKNDARPHARAVGDLLARGRKNKREFDA